MLNIADHEGNANQNQKEISLNLSDIPQPGCYQKEYKQQMLIRMLEKREPSPTDDENRDGAVIVENSMEVSQKTKNRNTI